MLQKSCSCFISSGSSKWVLAMQSHAYQGNGVQVHSMHILISCANVVCAQGMRSCRCMPDEPQEGSPAPLLLPVQVGGVWLPGSEAAV
jgi:hypothetical protein